MLSRAAAEELTHTWLLAGPFYTAADKAVREAAFFGDSEVLGALDSTWRKQKVPGGGKFFKEQANWSKFWKCHAVDADEELFKTFCLREQVCCSTGRPCF